MAETGRSLSLSALSVGTCILLSNVIIIRAVPLEHQAGNVWMFVIGGLFVLLGFGSAQNDQRFHWLEAGLVKVAAWFDIQPWQIVILFSSLIFGALATTAAGFEARMYSPVMAIVAWLVGMVLAVYGGWHSKEAGFRISRATLLTVISLVVFAFIIRAMETKQIPFFLTGDESLAGLSAVEFAEDRWNNIFITAWYSFPSLFPFIESLFIRFMGQTTEALRLPAALAGALTVGAVYVMGREMFNSRVGLFAALILAALHFHIHFSRLGLNNIWDGLWFTITITALWYGWKYESRKAYIVGGLALGIAQYFYSTSRALFAMLLLALLLASLFQRAKLRNAIPHMLVGIVCFLVVALPLIWYYLNRPNDFITPYTRFSMLGEPDVFSQLSTWAKLPKTFLLCIGAYTYTPLTHFWYAPETPILRPIAALLFYAGFLFLIIDSRDSRLYLVIIWLIAFGCMATLSDFPPASQRYVAAAPACAILVGYGLYRLGNFLEQFLPQFRIAITSLTFLTLAMAMTSDLYFYFIDYTFTDQLGNINSNGTIAQELANYLAPKPPRTTVFFLGTPDSNYHSVASVEYLAPQVTGVDVLVPWQTFEHANLEGDKAIFIFIPERASEFKEIAVEFPGCQLTEKRAWNLQPLFRIYDCTAGPATNP